MVERVEKIRDGRRDEKRKEERL